MVELQAERSAVHSEDPALDDRPRLVSMCDACERVPVPVIFSGHQGQRGLYLCAACLAGEGILLSEEEDAGPGAD